MSGAAGERERLLEAVAETMAGRGYARFRVDAVVAAAGVTREVFFEHFADESAAVLAAHREVFEPFYASLSRACEEAPGWPRGVRAAIEAALEFAREHPERAQLMTVEGLPRAVRAASEIQESIDRLAALLSRGRRLSEEAAQLPPVTERLLVGGISTIVFVHLADGESERLPQLKRELAEFVLIPFLGVDSAARVATER